MSAKSKGIPRYSYRYLNRAEHLKRQPIPDLHLCQKGFQIQIRRASNDKP